MKNEIKKIFDNIKYELHNNRNFILMTDKDIEILLEYIFNLQKEVIKLTAESTEWEFKFYDLQEKYVHLDKVNCQLRKKINNGDYEK